MKTILFKNVVGFEWDKGNKDKNFLKHGVVNEECEEVFFGKSKMLFQDKQHSLLEKRYIILGYTKENRLLFIVFTIRKNHIRVVTARDMNKKERGLYEKTI